MRSATDLSGRSIVITGANSGIGLEATRELARRGASVTLACRSSERAVAAIAHLRSELPHAELRILADEGHLLALTRWRELLARLETTRRIQA